MEPSEKQGHYEASGYGGDDEVKTLPHPWSKVGEGAPSCQRRFHEVALSHQYVCIRLPQKVGVVGQMWEGSFAGWPQQPLPTDKGYS